MPSIQQMIGFYPSRYYSVDPNTGILAPRTPTPRQAFQTEDQFHDSSLTETTKSKSVWTKILTAVGIFCGLALITAAIVIPLYLVPALTATTTLTTTTTTSTTTTTTAVTLYVPGNYLTPCTSVCTNVSTTTPSTLTASWKFENNPQDSTGLYSGYITSGASYVSGYANQALAVNSAQYMTVSTYLNFNSRSFTIGAWIYVTSIVSSTDYGIFGQCQTTTSDRCFHCLIRSNKLFLGFFTDDISGSTIVPTNVWIHTAFVYDLTTNTKSVYLNGILDGTTTSGSYYQGTTAYTYVGYATDSLTILPLPGLIDQVTVSNRAKTTCEILNDATLVSQFTFDGVITDSGGNNLPSYITRQGNSGMSYVSGRVSQSLMLSASNSFFQSCGYYSLSRTNQSFSFALWINPTIIGGTILHLSSDQSGSGGWCFPSLGFSLNGSLVAQGWKGSVVSLYGPQIPVSNWTHVVQTWSATNGLQLYINGALYGSAPMSNYNNNNGLNLCIFLGTSGFGTNCQNSDIVLGSYSGAFDEFYVYNRELTPAEICPLAHP